MRARLAAGIGKLAKTETKTKKPTLLYFPMPGRALPCRVALFHTLGKAGWTDRHIGFEEFRTEQQAPAYLFMACYGLLGYSLYSHCLYGYGLYSHCLYSYGLHGNRLYSYGLYSYGLYSYGLYRPM